MLAEAMLQGELCTIASLLRPLLLDVNCLVEEMILPSYILLDCLHSSARCGGLTWGTVLRYLENHPDVGHHESASERVAEIVRS